MENVKEINSEPVKNADDEKDLEKQNDGSEQLTEDNQLETQNEIPQESKEVDEKQQKETEPSAAAEQIVQQNEPQTIDYQEDDEYDDDDDDEEKDTSQKLVIDIPEDEEEEKEDEDDDSDVIALDDLPEEVVTKNDIEKVSAKPMNVDTIITLSDGEEETTNDAASKPGKVQKRRSMGASTPNEEEQFRLKRRKINAAGAPKLPQTGYVRYMNDRRESIRKEHPSKTHMEHNKIIGEEWHSLSADVKSSYLKAADVDKQRSIKITTKQQFRKLLDLMQQNPDVGRGKLACCSNKNEKKAMWNFFAEELNSLGPPFRTRSEWQRVWIHFKAKTKKKLAKNRVNVLATGRSEENSLSPLVESVISLVDVTRQILPEGQAFGVENVEPSATASTSVIEDAEISSGSAIMTATPRKRNANTKDVEQQRQQLLKQQLKIQEQLLEKISNLEKTCYKQYLLSKEKFEFKKRRAVAEEELINLRLKYQRKKMAKLDMEMQ